MIHPQNPWLGYSPDGLLFENDILKSLEIKCPIQGIHSRATDIITSLNYIHMTGGTYMLKEKHKYYGQVQCGMHLTNAEECFFVIFASYNNSYVLIRVLRNEDFIIKMFTSLHHVYFNYFLAYIHFYVM